MNKISYTITDPNTGQVKNKTMDDTPENRILVDTLAKTRGLVINYNYSPEQVVALEAEKAIQKTETPQGALLEGFLTGVTLEGKEELKGLLGGESAQRKAELQRKKVEEERPVSFGAGKFVGGLLPSGLATAAGGALGGAFAGPPGAIAGAALGGAAAAGLESILEEPMGEKDLDYEDLIDTAIGGLAGGLGKRAVPLIRGIARKLSIKPISELSAKEKVLKEQLDFLKEAKALYKYNLQKLRQGDLTSAQVMKKGRELLANIVSIEKLQKEIAMSFKNNFLAGIPVSGVELIDEEQPEMTQEEMREYERLSVEEALEKQRKKKQTPVRYHRFAKDIYP